MLITQQIEIVLQSKNISYFKEKGYEIPTYIDNLGREMVKKGTKITINIQDLKRYSREYVQVKCDYCTEEHIFEVSYKKFNEGRVSIPKDCCDKKECKEKKHSEVMRLYKNTEKYKESQEKRKRTINEKYGVPYAIMSDYCKEKNIQSNLLKYGHENIFKSEKFKEIRKKTNLEKYGYEFALQNPEVQAKRIESLYKNGTQKSSRQQRYIYDLFKTIYNVELNYLVNKSFLDIAFPNENIYVEYDGGFHDGKVICGDMTREEFDKKEMIRSIMLTKQGWKEIRIISKMDILPSDIKLIEMLKFALNYLNDHHYIKFDVDNSIIINSQGVFDYDFGELRQIHIA